MAEPKDPPIPLRIPPELLQQIESVAALTAKINLTPSGKLIIIYSAHVPLKGEENL